ncbi:MAG: DNA-binding response regulator [Bacteroidetes bacterium GWF2_38_335]|nr:MAG: DNA-binding response regulator [Bacteroidetes bacterium GWF2_38_335]OFY78494.1 MAG: DNA-binding response regulator [Bacteroidetes bacterium RIFOXYA12_FULL_38_20]HBS88442.1 DNA-binding response regulator [Bacteroidales bacterium]
MVLNCIIIDDDKLSRKVIEEFVNRTESLNLINSYSSAVEAINVFNIGEEINLIFLDIEMPVMTGLEFLKTLSDPPQIVIISAKEKYALEAFEYDVTDYLLKPVSYARFFKAVDKVLNHYRDSHDKRVAEENDEIFIKKSSSLVRLKYDDILWIEALENYVIVNTFSEKFTIHFTMKAIEKKLPLSKFKRVHRSYIVNVSRINVIEDNAIIVNIEDGSKVIPIGKSYKDKLMNDLNLMVK